LLLAAAGYRQESPRPGLVYYDFGRGPAFVDLSLFADWLHYLRSEVAGDAIYIRMAPYHRMDADGPSVEALLAREGFQRDTQTGTWASLLVDVTPSEDDLFMSFQRQTRQQLGKCDRAGFTVESSDDPEGWEAFCRLHAELRPSGFRMSAACTNTGSRTELAARSWSAGSRASQSPQHSW